MKREIFQELARRAGLTSNRQIAIALDCDERRVARFLKGVPIPRYMGLAIAALAANLEIPGEEKDHA